MSIVKSLSDLIKNANWKSVFDNLDLHKAHKYVSRRKVNGKWVYTYADDKKGKQKKELNFLRLFGVSSKDELYKASVGKGDKFKVGDTHIEVVGSTLSDGKILFKDKDGVKSLSKKGFVDKVLKAHAAEVKQYIDKGLSKREAILSKAKEIGNAKTIAAAQRELNKFKSKVAGKESKDTVPTDKKDNKPLTHVQTVKKDVLELIDKSLTDQGLTGSEKQISWAQKLRSSFVEQYRSLPASGDMNDKLSQYTLDNDLVYKSGVDGEKLYDLTDDLDDNPNSSWPDAFRTEIVKQVQKTMDNASSRFWIDNTKTSKDRLNLKRDLEKNAAIEVFKAFDALEQAQLDATKVSSKKAKPKEKKAKKETQKQYSERIKRLKNVSSKSFRSESGYLDAVLEHSDGSSKEKLELSESIYSAFEDHGSLDKHFEPKGVPSKAIRDRVFSEMKKSGWLQSKNSEATKDVLFDLGEEVVLNASDYIDDREIFSKVAEKIKQNNGKLPSKDEVKGMHLKHIEDRVFLGNDFSDKLEAAMAEYQTSEDNFTPQQNEAISKLKTLKPNQSTLGFEPSAAAKTAFEMVIDRGMAELSIVDSQIDDYKQHRKDVADEARREARRADKKTVNNTLAKALD